MKELMKATVLLSALLFVSVLSVPLAEAQAGRPWGRYGGAIDLTDKQLDRIQEIRQAFQNEILPLEMKWRKLDLELEALSWKGQPLDVKLKELESLELEMDKKWEAHQNQIRSVLTDDQKVLFDRSGGLGLGLGWGPGGGAGMNPRWGMRMGAGRGTGYGWAPGMGRGYGGYGRGYGAGMGRGYFCPWRRW
jgi:hypothetical protein